MKLKKMAIFALALLLVIALAACSSGSNTNNGAGNNSANNGANNDVPSSNTGNSNTDNEAPKDDYPNKEIEWVIPFSPGSGADVFARTLIKLTEKHLGQTIIPVNKEGGSTAVGVSYVLSKPADGYTLFSHSTTLPYTIASGQLPFTAEEIQGINRINADVKTLAVNASSDIQSFEDLIAKAKSKPGSIKIGGVGTKSWSDVFYNKMIQGAGIEATYVPYDGGSEVVLALLGNNLDAIVITGSNINSQVDAGEIRMLAISTSERIDSRPDVPTFKELGFSNISDDVLWRGIFGKVGIPQERLDILSEAVGKALKDPEWQEYMEKEQQIDAFQNAADFQKVFKQDIEDGKATFSSQ